MLLFLCAGAVPGRLLLVFDARVLDTRVLLFISRVFIVLKQELLPHAPLFFIKRGCCRFDYMYTELLSVCAHAGLDTGMDLGHLDLSQSAELFERVLL